MPYLVPHFDPDVFVSYSHGDPLGNRAPLRDWTQALIRRLNDRLHALETEFDDLHIWMDPESDPTAYLTEELRAKTRGCGVLMIVMSNRYLKSKWCGDELDWFQQQIQRHSGQGGRVFVIHAQKTDAKLWPVFLCDERGHPMTGFQFYDPEDGSPMGFELREPNDDYFKALGRLQYSLVNRLRGLRERAAQREPAELAGSAALQPTGKRLIYLYSRPDDEVARADVDRALISQGIVTLTTQASAGKSSADFQREANTRLETAKRCEALALLRAGDGERFVGDLLDIGVSERERIAAARGVPMPCAVLDKTGERMPISVAQFGIERFDVNVPDWRGQFSNWLDAARGRPAEARA